jgi:hypothetical protein
MTEPKLDDATAREARKERERKILALGDGTFAEPWFTWLGWVLITGALYAVGEAAKSVVFHGLAYFSAGLVLLYALTKINAFVGAIATKSHTLSGLVSWILMGLAIVLQFVFAITLSKVINAAFDAKLPLN